MSGNDRSCCESAPSMVDYLIVEVQLECESKMRHGANATIVGRK
jgi:hypothetical protein